MKLRVWILHHRLTTTHFAEWIGCDRSVVHKWATGESLPTPENMRAIYRKTRGEVTPNDFYDLPRLAVHREDADTVAE